MCLPLVVNPVSCVGPMKAQSVFTSSTPGLLFTQPKPEPASSNTEGWKFFSNVTVQPSPAVPASSSTQDFHTVNLSDLHDFSFPNFVAPAPDQTDMSSRRDGPGGNGAATATTQEVQNTFASMMDVNEIPEFPSFSEAHPSDVENINTDEFQALLGQSGLAGETSSVCHVNASGNAAMVPNDVEQVDRNMGNGTWMSFPPSIVNLLQNQQMTDAVVPGTSAADAGVSGTSGTPSVFEDLEMLNSMDEDRLMSILNVGSEVGFLSGHPT